MAESNSKQPPEKRLKRDGNGKSYSSAVTAISSRTSPPGLEERIAGGETVLCAEGYLLAICRRGYITHGVWVPEFMLEQPEVLRGVHEEFVHAGTDVVQAFQVVKSHDTRLSFSLGCSSTLTERR